MPTGEPMSQTVRERVINAIEKIVRVKECWRLPPEIEGIPEAADAILALLREHERGAIGDAPLTRIAPSPPINDMVKCEACNNWVHTLEHNFLACALEKLYIANHKADMLNSLLNKAMLVLVDLRAGKTDLALDIELGKWMESHEAKPICSSG